MNEQPTTREILDALLDFRSAVEHRFDSVEAHLVRHDVRFDGIDRRLDHHDYRLDAIERRLGRLETRMDAVER